MADDLPPPLVPPDVDCTDLDGFMLNTERLMASELVAVSSLEVIGAALLLWARAWKQIPTASLPDDERVMAAFCKLPVARFRKLRTEILHGFVKCADGRLYHRFLAPEAVKAYAHKVKHRERREADAKRLNDWRKKRDGNAHQDERETQDETAGETRFVREGQGQDRDRTGTGLKKERKKEEESVGFAALYAAYPRKVARGDALKAYRAALKKTTPEVLLAGAIAAAKHYAGKDPRYIPHPATWLSGERWADEAGRLPSIFGDDDATDEATREMFKELQN